MSRKKKSKNESMSESEYIQTFCQEKRIRHRWAVYVSQETHQKLQKVVSVFKDHYVTTMSLADAILSHHFEANDELLTRLYSEYIEKAKYNVRSHAKHVDNSDVEPEE